MLGLAEQIHGHPIGRRAAIGQHQNFRRPGDHVYADRAKHTTLGRCHISVARAGDFVHTRDCRRAVSHGGHGLRATDGESAADTGHISCGQYEFIALAARSCRATAHCAAGGNAAAHRSRHHHDDLAHTGHMRGNRVHQQAGRISRFAAGHVNTGAVQGRDFLTEQTAVGVAVLPAFAAGFFLRFVVAAYAGGGVLQGAFLRFGQAVKRGFEIGLLQLQVRHGGGLQTVKARGVVQHGGVAARFHIGKNVGDALLDGRIGVSRPMQTLLKQRFKICLCGAQA